MKAKIATIIMMVLFLALPSISTGCGWLWGGKAFIDIMKNVPENSTSFSYWEIKKVSEDKDLQDKIYTKFRESLEAKQLKDIGIVLSDVKCSGKASSFNQGTSDSA